MSAAPLDRHDLYEACVQAPNDLVPMLRGIHGGEPRDLGEDFCGGALLAATWTELVPQGRAIAVDHDPEALDRAGRRAASRPRLMIVAGDVIAATDPVAHAVDVVFAGNFSIGERRDRAALLDYLRHVHARLRPGWVFICDLYGGESAFLLGEIDREHPLPDGGTLGYLWRQVAADPLTGQVENAIDFALTHADGTPGATIRDAFVYHWRLWSIPELRDALHESGFAATEVWPRIPDAVDDAGLAYAHPYDAAHPPDDDYDLFVVGRK